MLALCAICRQVAGLREGPAGEITSTYCPTCNAEYRRANGLTPKPYPYPTNQGADAAEFSAEGGDSASAPVPSLAWRSVA